MKQFLCLTLEFLPLIPGMLLAYLPMKAYRKLRFPHLAALTCVLTLLLSLSGGAVCFFFPVSTRFLSVPVAAVLGCVYVRTLDVSRWKSVSVFLAVCAVIASLDIIVTSFDSTGNPAYTALHSSPGAAASLNLLCWIFLLAAWYPAAHAARTLVSDDVFARTWYVFWILPFLFIGLDLFMRPLHPAILQQGRTVSVYMIISFFLFFLLLLLYTLFYFMASSLNRNEHLRQENHLFAVQQERYQNLQAAIEETREMRHDMRHHFDILLELAEKQEWTVLMEYLCDARGTVSDTSLHLCDNPVTDSVAGHYWTLYKKADVPVSFALDLPAVLPVSETDFCIVLSNLLENALEASLKLPVQKRKVRAQAYLHTPHMLLLSVENTFGGKIIEKDGAFQSSKRREMGVGIQSVRRIAEKNGGYSRFFFGDGSFHANVMLRGGMAED